MKKSQYIIALLSFFTIFVFGQSALFCKSNQAEVILSTFKRLENNYISVANERLIGFLNEDPILKENFLTGDSSNYKKLKLIIRPILKFKKEAEKFTYFMDIFDVIEFDTINFHCLAQYYLEDSLVFYIIRGFNNCDYFHYPDHDNSCPGEFIFFQYFYKPDKVKDCEGPPFPIYPDTSFIFQIDCFPYGFSISENKIRIYPSNYNEYVMRHLDSPNSFIIDTYDLKLIRYFAKGCPDDNEKP